MNSDLAEFGDTSNAEVASPSPSSQSESCAPRKPSDYMGITRGSLVCWSSIGDGSYMGSERTVSAIRAGMYAHSIDPQTCKTVLTQLPINVDELIRFPDGVSDLVLHEIERFWSCGNAFEQYGFLHRRGYLFFGPQGSGKSSVVQQIIKDVIDRDGVVFLSGDLHSLCRALSTFRQIEPMRNIVVLFEDIDAIIKSQHEETLLALLDGETQINRVLNIATTNYPELLDKRLVARPRRFDRVVKIGMPNAAVRRKYFEIKLVNEDIDTWVEQTDGLSFAALAEAVVSVKCLGNSFEETIRVLRSMNNPVSSDDFKERTGFTTARAL